MVIYALFVARDRDGENLARQGIMCTEIMASLRILDLTAGSQPESLPENAVLQGQCCHQVLPTKTNARSHHIRGSWFETCISWFFAVHI